MQISSSNRLIRFAYLISDDGPPRQVSLCKLFWRIVLTTIPFLMLATLLSSYVFALIYDTYDALVATAVLVALIATVIFIVAVPDKVRYYYRVRRAAEQQAPKEPSIILEALYGIKHRFCPIITIVDEREVPYGYYSDDDEEDENV